MGPVARQCGIAHSEYRSGVEGFFGGYMFYVLGFRQCQALLGEFTMSPGEVSSRTLSGYCGSQGGYMCS